MPNIEIYTTPTCPFCIMAKHLLSRKTLSFKEIDVASDPDERATMMQRAGRHTVPQIFINGRPVGGFDDLAALDASGELEHLLASGEADDSLSSP